MATEFGNQVGYGSIGSYYQAVIGYVVSYPDGQTGRVQWSLYVRVTGSLVDSNNSANASGDLKNQSYGSHNYNLPPGGDDVYYAAGTTDFQRVFDATTTVEQEFWIQDLADAVGGGARSTASLSIELDARDPEVPDAPAEPTVTSIQQDRATVNMVLPPANGAPITDTGFWIYDAASGGNVVSTDGVVNTQTSAVLTGLAASTNYWAEVKAKNSVGWSAASPRKAFTSAALTVPDAPNAPGVVVNAPNDVDVSWNTPNANGSTISGYQVQISTDSMFGTLVVNENVAASPLNVTSLLASTSYWARVRANSDQGYSAWSATTPFDTGVAVPDAPTGLDADPIYATEATIDFVPGADNGAVVTGYQMQIRTTGTLGTMVLGLDALGDNLVYDVESLEVPRDVDGLTPGTRYYVTVRTNSNQGYSLWSSVLQFDTYGGLWIKVAGEWKPATLHIKVAGEWKPAELFLKAASVWEKVL